MGCSGRGGVRRGHEASRLAFIGSQSYLGHGMISQPRRAPRSLGLGGFPPVPALSLFFKFTFRLSGLGPLAAAPLRRPPRVGVPDVDLRDVLQHFLPKKHRQHHQITTGLLITTIITTTTTHHQHQHRHHHHHQQQQQHHSRVVGADLGELAGEGVEILLELGFVGGADDGAGHEGARGREGERELHRRHAVLRRDLRVLQHRVRRLRRLVPLLVALEQVQAAVGVVALIARTEHMSASGMADSEHA
eukprot:3659695-Rhodomonas_salina.1